MRNLAGILALAVVVSSGCVWIHDPDPANDDRCPSGMPDDGSFCSGNDTCSYGGLACQCGGPCQPAFGCQCLDGRWSCWHADPVPCGDESPDRPDAWQDLPPDAPLESCPDNESANGFACRQEGFSCEFGPVACQCGSCHPAFGCACVSGRWSCWHTDPVPESWCADVPPADAYPDFAPVDVPYEYWSSDVPVPACCAKNADCGPGYACGTLGGSANGTCKPALPFGQCWSEEDCATGDTCLGAAVCPCTADCDMLDQSGVCTPMPAGCCWTDSDCNDGTVCRAQGGIGGLPGACVPDPLGPFCPGDTACCWNDADCFGAGTCEGASACGCIELCPMCGACAPDQVGTCAP